MSYEYPFCSRSGKARVDEKDTSGLMRMNHFVGVQGLYPKANAALFLLIFL